MADRKLKTPLSVYLLCCLIIPVWSMARVENRTNWRVANTTKLNSIHQGWKTPSVAPITQWNRNNQTSTGYNNWNRNNNTHYGHQQPHNSVGWGAPNTTNTIYAPRPQPQPNNPWVRNNQTAHPQNPQQNIGWGARPSATSQQNFGQQNWNSNQSNSWSSGGSSNLPRQPNSGWTSPSYNGTSSFAAGTGLNLQSTNFTRPNPGGNPSWFGFSFGQSNTNPQYPQNSGWNVQPNNFTRPYSGFPPANNNFGFGQPNFNRTNPQTPPTAGWAGAKPAYNGTFPGFNPPPQSQPNPAAGGGWNPGYNAGQVPPASPLAPIGNNVAPIGFSGAAALAPLAGGGGSQASLSYANGQQLPAGAGQQKPVGASTNPYANMFN